jgi:hypothetical protein
MIKKEEAEKKKSKIKRAYSYRKRGRSLSSSSEDSQPRRSDLKEKFIPSETTRNFDMNYYKLQYENYLKNAASFFSSQSMGNGNNAANINNKSITASHALNPLVNHMYQNQFANFYTQNQPNYKPELNAFQNNFPNLNMMPTMLPMLNPYMHMVPFNHNFPQSFPPVAIDMSEDQNKHIERININNYNISKNPYILFSKKYEFRNKKKEDD